MAGDDFRDGERYGELKACVNALSERTTRLEEGIERYGRETNQSLAAIQKEVNSIGQRLARGDLQLDGLPELMQRVSQVERVCDGCRARQALRRDGAGGDSRDEAIRLSISRKVAVGLGAALTGAGGGIVALYHLLFGGSVPPAAGH